MLPHWHYLCIEKNSLHLCISLSLPCYLSLSLYLQITWAHLVLCVSSRKCTHCLVLYRSRVTVKMPKSLSWAIDTTHSTLQQVVERTGPELQRTVGGLGLNCSARECCDLETAHACTPLFEIGETVFEQFFVEIARRTAEGSKATLDRDNGQKWKQGNKQKEKKENKRKD